MSACLYRVSVVRSKWIESKFLYLKKIFFFLIIIIQVVQKSDVICKKYENFLYVNIKYQIKNVTNVRNI